MSILKTLRPYQQTAIDNIIRNYGNGINKQVFQLAPGGGKTLTSSALIKRYVDAKEKKVLFVVHREELLEQFRKTYYSQYGIIVEPIIAGAKYRNPKSQIYVTMVETANNRLKNNPKWFGDVGMVIIDECHIGSHNKLYQYFDRDNILIVGLTATPLSSTKKNPLKEHFDEIVCGIDIPELIEQKALVPNITYLLKNINRNEIKIKNGEFDKEAMFNEYRKSKHIENCVLGYEKHALGKKTLIFNCNIEHSELVNEAFLKHGYNSKHLDGATNKEDRAAILKWFKETPDAILQNVGVLTAGFDEPSIECIIMNRATLSLPLWLQCCGRGSRPFSFKDFFIILDMGGNALAHGDWCTPRNWHYLFHNPPQPGKKKEDAVAPVKCCVKCEAIIAAQARTCQFCGAEQPVNEVGYDVENVEFELLKSNINIQNINIQTRQLGHNPYASLHQTKALIVSQAKQQQLGINETIAYNLLEVYQEKVREWCSMERKPYNDFHKQITSKWFFDELKRVFGFEFPQLKLVI